MSAAEIEATAAQMEGIATELELAAAHARIAAKHMRDREFSRYGAHTFAALGNLAEAQHQLDVAAKSFARKSPPGAA